MFTGIIDHCGIVEQITEHKAATRIWIKNQFDDFKLGESIAVDGVCLTVTEFNDSSFCCDISPETLRVTTANLYQVGSRVNLERPLRAADRIGGHFVLGHVDTVTTLQRKQQYAEFSAYTFANLPAASMGLLVEKGSVAVNGISLTLNEIQATSFTVMLIPHTLQITNLGELAEGGQVNLELDYLAKIVAKNHAYKL